MTGPVIGAGTTVHEAATVGVSHAEVTKPPVIGKNGVIREGTIIYDDVEVGDGLQTGHHALIREHTDIGDDVLVGTNAVLDGGCDIGDRVSFQTGVYIPYGARIGDRVFLGPHATLLNDRYPVRTDGELEGPILDNDVTIGGNATILPGTKVGQGAFVAAGSVVTENVPPETLAMGAPARIKELPHELHGRNKL